MTVDTRHINSPINRAHVAQIKALLALGMQQKPLADYYKLTASVVSAISTGRNWSHIKASEGVSFGYCSTCQKLIIDNGERPELIYVVATDEYYCNEKCEACHVAQ